MQQTKAQQLKQKGNEAFKLENYNDAIKLYSEAIMEDNTESVYYSNRALCFYIQEKYQESYDDATEAVQLNEKNIKAHMLVGQSICMLAKYKLDSSKIDIAIVRILKARTLCAGQKKQEYEKEIDEKINKAKKMKWFIQQEEVRIKNLEIVQQLQEEIKKDDRLNENEKQITLKKIDKYIINEKPDLEIPDYLKCHLTQKLLIDPWTTEAGYSYEKNELFKIDPLTFDPFTKTPINAKNIYSNINLKKAANEFLLINPWAFDYNANQSYKDIAI
ncbi:unnamed protein product [Paramecium sonneborni]|uniref:RING-type E3 ubiquitin transferase n=1 Tax=Paramecium sonneborni TaxID=65129 RepID=A0A8S1MI33_9CILI|nr:unnamed protein product [Paramecium sonneborni]